MRITKKRLAFGAGTATAIGAAATLIAGTTFGLFSATQTSSGNSFTAGTLTLGSPVVANCSVSDKLPGDSGDCTVAVTTGGSAAQIVGIDVSVAPGSTEPVASVPQSYDNSCVNAPADGLYDASVNGMQISLSSTDGSTPVSSYDLSGLNAATSSTTGLLTASSVASGTTETYKLHWSIADNGCVDNNYQGASSSFTFTVHSVQSANQPADATTPGSVDSTISWS